MDPRLMYLMRSRTLPFPFPCSIGETLSNSCSSAVDRNRGGPALGCRQLNRYYPSLPGKRLNWPAHKRFSPPACKAAARHDTQSRTGVALLSEEAGCVSTHAAIVIGKGALAHLEPLVKLSPIIVGILLDGDGCPPHERGGPHGLCNALHVSKEVYSPCAPWIHSHICGCLLLTCLPSVFH